MSALLPIKLNDFLKIAEDNNRTIWIFETDKYFEFYMVSDGVISYTEMNKGGINVEQFFSNKVFFGSKQLPISLRLANNNFNNAYIDSETKKRVIETSIPVSEEDKKTEIQYREEIRLEIKPTTEQNSKYLPNFLVNAIDNFYEKKKRC